VEKICHIIQIKVNPLV